MPRIGTPLSPTATRVLLCGSGELGKEVVIELQRLGCEVIACDRYANAPAMQVAHRSHTLNMLDPAALRDLVAHEKPHLVVPEIEAIHTPTLVELERDHGQRVVPTARAARLTMDREGIRRLAAETLGLPTSPYRFVDTREQYLEAVRAIGLPCVVKPLMSSSGKGQSTVRSEADVDAAWDYAQSGGRAGQGRAGPPDRVDVGRRQGDGWSLRGPPSGRLGVDPDILVGLLECRPQGDLEAGGREVILPGILRVPPLLPPVVIEPEPESGRDHTRVSRPVGGQRGGVAHDGMAGVEEGTSVPSLDDLMNPSYR